MTAPHVQNVLSHLRNVKKTGPEQWQARCPAHEDRKPSLSVSVGRDGRVLVLCHAGCPTEAVVAAVGLELRDLFAEDGTGNARPAAKVANSGPPSGEIVVAYDYHDADGQLLYQVVRYDPKDFRQRRPDGKGGWTWNLDGVPRVLYRLPELLAADPAAPVFVCEGEKDVDNVRVLGLTATCNPGGAGKWGKLADDFALHGRRVAVVPDCDEPGHKHAPDVAARLHGNAADVRILDLGTIEGFTGKDVSDWLERRDGLEPEALARVLLDMAAAAPRVTPGRLSIVKRLADVKPEPVRWLWPERVALGKVTLLAGDPGLGKSFLTLDLAARVSRGSPWPDRPDVPGTVGGVVLLSAEDDLADTIRPRLDAAGADVGRIVALEAVRRMEQDGEQERIEPFVLSADLAALEEAIRKCGECRLVVLDPISAYLGMTDSHVNAEVRAALAPLAELAARCGVAVVAVTHLRKGEGPAMYRAMGSLAFVAAARAVFAVARDQEDATGARRYMLPLKNNLSADATGFAFRLDAAASTNGQPVVMWEQTPIRVSAEEALRYPDGVGERRTPALSEAMAWLREWLMGGPRLASATIAEGERNGIHKRTLDRAKTALRVLASKDGFDGGWSWRLPEGDEDCQALDSGNHGNLRDVGNLRTKGALEARNDAPRIP